MPIDDMSTLLPSSCLMNKEGEGQENTSSRCLGVFCECNSCQFIMMQNGMVEKLLSLKPANCQTHRFTGFTRCTPGSERFSMLKSAQKDQGTNNHKQLICQVSWKTICFQSHPRRRSDRQAIQVTFRIFRTQLGHDLLTWPGYGLNVGKFPDSMEEFMGLATWLFRRLLFILGCPSTSWTLKANPKHCNGFVTFVWQIYFLQHDEPL